MSSAGEGRCPVVDSSRALVLLDAVRAGLADLDRYTPAMDAKRLRTDRDAQNMVLFAIYSATQAAIDLA